MGPENPGLRYSTKNVGPVNIPKKVAIHCISPTPPIQDQTKYINKQVEHQCDFYNLEFTVEAREGE